MSYSSRVYRQRNPHSHEESSKDGFFTKQKGHEKKNNNGSFFQAKLAVNKPGDAFETEADSVANKVVDSKSDSVVVQQKDISNVQRSGSPAEEKKKLQKAPERKKEEIQKQAEPEAEMEEDVQKKETEQKEEEKKPIQKKDALKEEKDKPMQKKEVTEEEKESVQKKEVVKEDEKKAVQKKDEDKKKEEGEAVQRKTEFGDNKSEPVLFRRLHQPEGNGIPLPGNILKKMNSAFGADFSQIRIHSDNEAAEMSKALHAQAFAHGTDIYFNYGKYNTSSSEGEKLLAHELTHTIQQTGKEPEHKHTSNLQREEDKGLDEEIRSKHHTK
jgi:hypothetical protein